MIGHPEPDLRDFGWAARARCVANWIPARLSGALLCMMGGGWRIVGDCRRHASPNAGWPEAAMAGAIHARLARPISYDGVLRDKPWIGDGPPAGLAQLARALSVYRRGCALMFVLVGFYGCDNVARHRVGCRQIGAGGRYLSRSGQQGAVRHAFQAAEHVEQCSRHQRRRNRARAYAGLGGAGAVAHRYEPGFAETAG
jgi:hypothetical protein